MLSARPQVYPGPGLAGGGERNFQELAILLRRWPHMLTRLFLGYVAIEMAVVIGLGLTIGFGWTVLVLLAACVLGLVLLAPVARWHLGRQLVQVRFGQKESASAVADGAVVTVATGLVLMPGLATTTMGLLLLVPPIRVAAGPALTAIAVRGFQRHVSLTPEAAASVADVFNLGGNGNNRDFIDGEVINVTDVTDVEPQTLSQSRIGAEPPPRPASSPS